MDYFNCFLYHPQSSIPHIITRWNAVRNQELRARKVTILWYVLISLYNSFRGYISYQPFFIQSQEPTVATIFKKDVVSHAFFDHHFITRSCHIRTCNRHPVLCQHSPPQKDIGLQTRMVLEWEWQHVSSPS